MLPRFIQSPLGSPSETLKRGGKFAPGVLGFPPHQQLIFPPAGGVAATPDRMGCGLWPQRQTLRPCGILVVRGHAKDQSTAGPVLGHVHLGGEVTCNQSETKLCTRSANSPALIRRMRHVVTCNQSAFWKYTNRTNGINRWSLPRVDPVTPSDSTDGSNISRQMSNWDIHHIATCLHVRG